MLLSNSYGAVQIASCHWFDVQHVLEILLKKVVKVEVAFSLSSSILLFSYLATYC